MNQGLYRDLLASTLQTNENLGKPRVEERVVKAVRPVFASNVVPYLQMISVESHSTSERKQD